MAPRTGISLCAGIGGLDLGLELACPDYRTVVYVERDAFAAATLVARMADSSLAPAPIWDDLSTFDGRPWRYRVDLVSAGFPCQPFSVAGKRSGTADDRWLWPHIARILGEVRPRYVFLENVRGFLAPAQRDAFGAVLGTLADLGLSAEWGVFRASDVGAPHRRERWFLLAHAEGISQREPDNSQCPESRERPRENTRGRIGIVGDPDSERLDGIDPRLQQWRPLEAGSQAERPNSQLGWPPGPGCRPEDWPEGTPQPAIRGDADGLPYRVDQLRALGNAVVPQQAALAFVTLAVPARTH